MPKSTKKSATKPTFATKVASLAANLAYMIDEHEKIVDQINDNDSFLNNLREQRDELEDKMCDARETIDAIITEATPV